MVFGTISAKTRISRVTMILTSPNHSEPNKIVACLPTPAEPMVFAMVLRESMAARGFSVSVLYFFISVAGA